MTGIVTLGRVTLSTDTSKNHYDVIVVGAGAAGLFAALTAGQRGKTVLIIDNGKKIGRKILISGGGRCNFTNYYIEPQKYLSANPHFCKSALSQYTQWDFLALVDQYQIAYHEKTLGQLFCDDSAKDIVSMLRSECEKASVQFLMQGEITQVASLKATSEDTNQYKVTTNHGEFHSHSLIIATGGLSMPKLGATPFAYKIAEQFGINVLTTRAGLVPFTLPPELKTPLAEISGVSTSITTSTNDTSFAEDLLFTHRGLSGPAILQISSYWQAGDEVSINLLPNLEWQTYLKEQIQKQPNISLKNLLANLFAKRLVDTLLTLHKFPNVPIKQLSHKHIKDISQALHDWKIIPSGTEGYRTAEVTLGGIDTNHISSKTMEVRNQPGLYFIGEALDVTGWLGGYNFQWAWSSGFVAGKSC
jgi:predicted Rossmann fold flavoprotein